jgi:VWFA-related protein
MTRFLLLCLFLFAASAAAFAQSPLPTPTPEDRDVVKITTNLIQIDVSVTDSKGRLVTDLKPEEVEIYENGKKQEITNFSFFNAVTKTVEKQATGKVDKSKTAIPIPSVPLKPEQVRRTLALVVDDLSLSFESFYQVQRALKRFVDQQMQPTDLVAVIRTSSGIGALQQFTSNKEQLYAAIDRVRWYPGGRADVAAFPILDPGINKTIRPPSLIGKQPDEDVKEAEEYRQTRFEVGTLGAIKYIVAGMERLPGRKSIVLFSDGFSLQDRGGLDARVMSSVRQLVDMANRGAVVISTMDARGLQPLEITAEDRVGELTINEVQEKLRERRSALFNSQAGMDYLAKVTGGISLKNQNDLSSGLEKVLNDQNGYYLVGYQPADATFDPATARYNTLEVKVTRPGVTVRSRSGFFGRVDRTDKSAPVVDKTPREQILNALVSPFETGDINIRLTPIFTDTERQGTYVSSLVHVKASDLKFTDEPDGSKQVVFDIVAIAMGTSGVAVDSISRTETMRVKGTTYDRIMREGFVYTIPFPIKKPGPYQMRIALRDAATAKIGSANQFIDVPDLKKERITVGGIILQNVADKQQNNGDGLPDPSQTDYVQNTALRQFRSGSALFYNATFYGAKLDAGKRPQIKTQVKIYRDGKEIFAEPETDYVPAPGDDLKRLPFRGAVRFTNGLPPGQYILQIIVSDFLAKEKNRVRTAWTDFEIVE